MICSKTVCKFDAYKIYLFLSFTTRLLFSLVFSINLLYQVTVAHLNPLQLVLVGTVVECSIFLFELPTGILADTKSRKLSIMVGCCLMGVGFIMEGSFPSFYMIALSQIVWGIGYTFISGATQAWITDEIGEARAGEAFIKGAQYESAGDLIAVPISIAMGLIALSIPIIAGGILMILLALSLYFIMPERGFKPVKREGTSIFKPMVETFTDAHRYVRSNRLLLAVFAVGIFFGLYSEGFDRLWTPHVIESFNIFAATGIKEVVFLGIMRIVLLVLSIVALEATNRKIKFENMRGIVKTLIGYTVAIILSLIGFGLINNLYVIVILFWLIGIARSVINPLQNAWLNNFIKSPNIRATIFSASSQIDAIGQVGGGIGLGFIGKLVSVKTVFVVSAIILSPVLWVYNKVMRISEADV